MKPMVISTGAEDVLGKRTKNAYFNNLSTIYMKIN